MTIVWREAMAVGNDTVDSEHKHLVELINNFEVAIGHGVDHKKVKRVLLGLVEYSAEHFRHEEQLQATIHYPFIISHQKAHRDLLKKLVSIVQGYINAPPDRRDQMIRGVAEFLRSWLIDHIIEFDLRMKPFMEIHGSAQGTGHGTAHAIDCPPNHPPSNV